MATMLELTRLESSPSGTIGSLSIDKRMTCWTLELQNKQNMRSISCIPTGQYFYEHYYSSKFSRMCLKIHNVYNRTSIRMHQGNTTKDTTGCILPGLLISQLEGKRALLQSNNALDRLIANTHQTGIITIRELF